MRVNTARSLVLVRDNIIVGMITRRIPAPSLRAVRVVRRVVDMMVNANANVNVIAIVNLRECRHLVLVILRDAMAIPVLVFPAAAVVVGVETLTALNLLHLDSYPRTHLPLLLLQCLHVERPF
jgi:hypothetical protein